MAHDRLLEKYVQQVRMDGIQTNKNATFGVNGGTPTVTINGPVVLNNTVTQGGVTSGVNQAITPTTGTATVTVTSSILTLTPTGNVTLNLSAPAGSGLFLFVEIVTSGTTSYNVTFGTNTVNQGVLATGIVSGVTYFVGFESDGTNWVEESRAASSVGGALPQTYPMATVFHSGRVGFPATTAATQTQIVTTDTYFCEVFIPAQTTITGVSILNGHTTNGSVNLSVGLANATGTIVANSATTTAQATADSFQKIPFTASYQAPGPAKYYICVQGSTTTGYIATHTIGNFGAALKTSETYGTFVTTASYSSTTFTTAQGPVADTY